MRERRFFRQKMQRGIQGVPKINESLYYSSFLLFSTFSNSSLKVNNELINSSKKSNKGLQRVVPEYSDTYKSNKE